MDNIQFVVVTFESIKIFLSLKAQRKCLEIGGAHKIGVGNTD